MTHPAPSATEDNNSINRPNLNISVTYEDGWCPDKTSSVSPPLNVPVHE